MDTWYDEDLSQNPFFIEFQNDHAGLFEQCVSEGWILCVPRIGSILSHIFTIQDFLGHVLVSNDELPTTHFITLTEKSVRVINKVISIDPNNAGVPLEIRILFEETFYNSDKMKYTVWCTEYPLELEFRIKSSTVFQCRNLKSLRDCIDFIWTEATEMNVLESIDLQILVFKEKYKNNLSIPLDKLKDLVTSLYTDCVETVIKNQNIKDKCKQCKTFMDNIKLSVETYLLHGIYPEIFENVCAYTAYDDSNFNKIVRNLCDIQFKDLGIQSSFNHCIPNAKKNLSLLQSYSTVLGKVCCIKNTMSAINKSVNNSGTKLTYATVDELLPIFIFLVIKSGIPNWFAHLYFLKHFRLSVHSYFESDESSFCISTLEATVEQIKRGITSDLQCQETHCQLSDDDTVDGFELISSDSLRKCSNSDVMSLDSRDSSSICDNLQVLFEQVKSSSVEKIREILEQNRNIWCVVNNKDSESDLDVSLEEVLNEDDLEKPLELCHPLCTCLKCCRIVTNNMMHTTPSVFSTDDKGFTILHVASMYGKPHIVELALGMGADINCADCNGSTPLHHAAFRGHQNVLLLLLHAGAAVNIQNLNKNTALHLAANNGHDCCVKALIYFNEHSNNKLNIAAQNDKGDTALHLASKWGYQSIARILLENGADSLIANSKGKSSIDCAHSTVMSKLLLSMVSNTLTRVDTNSHQKKDIDSTTKSQKILLDFKSNDRSLSENLGSAFKLNKSSLKPLSIDAIRHIERLFRAIAFGDVKLACFYMNIDSNHYKPYDSSYKPDSSDTTKVCHPLCSCQKCAADKLTQTSIGTPFNINTCDSKGDTSLHIAVKHNKLDICEIILRNEANPNILNNEGHSPLHIAARDNRVALTKLLLEYKSDSKVQDHMGNSVLHSACIAGSVEVVKVLLNFEPYEDVRNYSLRTPLDEAKDKMYLSIIALIEDNNNFKIDSI